MVFIARKRDAASSDLQVLQRVADARFVTTFTAATLAANPHATADVLMAVRAKTEMSYRGFTALELHPAYPLHALTNAGAHAFIDSFSDSDALRLCASPEVGVNLYRQLAFKVGEVGEALALANPFNHLTKKLRNDRALNSQQLFIAAVESGIWPSRDVIRGVTHVHVPAMRFTGEVWWRNGYKTELGPLPGELLLDVLLHTPNEDIAEVALKTIEGRSFELKGLLNATKNLHLDQVRVQARKRLSRILKEYEVTTLSLHSDDSEDW